MRHAGPPAALLAREVERTGGVPGAQSVRLAYDVLGPVPVGPVRASGRVLSFADVDLTVSLYRPPAGEWLAMAAPTSPGPGGTAQCFADPSDGAGRIGRSAATLLVEPR